jgi:hypothetical protein
MDQRTIAMTDAIAREDTRLPANTLLDVTHRRVADPDGRELNEAELGLVCGGITAPRDAATGQATGRRA